MNGKKEPIVLREKNIPGGENNRYKCSKVESLACLRNPETVVSGAGRVRGRVVQDEVGRGQTQRD